MESKWGARTRALVGCAAAITLIAPAAIADQQVESELQAMRDMVMKLQDQVQNQQQQIEEQSDRIQAAGIEEEGASSRLSSFLESTDFSGSIATSYTYNFNSPNPNAGGNTTWGSPFHPDHNTLQLDELWLSASREATDESPVGFGFDLVYGTLADVNGGGANANGNSIWVAQAYIDWMTPFGVSVKAGKFGTHIGYEVAGAAYNYTITRGLSYTQFQPVSQIGIKASTDIGPVSVMLGVVNSLAPNSPDPDDFKDVIWSVGWGTDMVSLSFNGEWGNDDTFYGQAAGFNGTADNQEAITLDWIAELTPNDATVIWLNVTYAQLLRDEEPWGLGLNVGTHVAITDKLGLTGRFEYGRSSSELSTGSRASGGNNGGPFNFAGGGGVAGPLGIGSEVDGISVTTGFDYMLAEGLTFKSEFRWDKVLDADQNGLSTDTADLQKIFNAFDDDDEFQLTAQLVYTF